MKKYIILALSLLTVLACSQFEEVNKAREVEPVSANVMLYLDPASGIPAPDSYTVRFINYDEKFEVTKQASADGRVTVDGLIPGLYNVSVAAEKKSSGFT